MAKKKASGSRDLICTEELFSGGVEPSGSALGRDYATKDKTYNESVEQNATPADDQFSDD